MNTANDPTSDQPGVARTLILALLLATGVIAMPVMQGCTALGIQQPQSFSEGYAYALSQTTAVRDASTTAQQAGQISVAEAEYLRDLTAQSLSLLDSALSVHQAGRPHEAQRRLALVNSVLLQVQSHLNASTK